MLHHLEDDTITQRMRAYLQIIAAVFALIGVGWVVHLWRRHWRASIEALPPGPRPWPIIGNLLELDAAAPHTALTRLAGRYGPVFGLQLGGVYTVVLADAELIREALRSEALMGRAPLYVTHGIMGGYGKSGYNMLQNKEKRVMVLMFLEEMS